MENDIIYFSDFPNLQETGTRKDNGKFDLTLLPTQELKEEFRGYIMYRCKNGTFRALIQDRTAYNHIAKFLNSRINRRIKSLGDRNPEKWISLLKGWMLEQGITIVKEKKSVKLTEMHLDDWTIARLLGHKRLNNVQHYRKMSNQRMADETREVRQRMSDIIYMSLARWGEEYEQIRQDD